MDYSAIIAALGALVGSILTGLTAFIIAMRKTNHELAEGTRKNSLDEAYRLIGTLQAELTRHAQMLLEQKTEYQTQIAGINKKLEDAEEEQRRCEVAYAKAGERITNLEYILKNAGIPFGTDSTSG